MYTVEKALDMDLNRDGQKGKPEPIYTEQLETVVKNESGLIVANFRTEDCNWDKRNAVLFFRATVNHQDLTEGRWANTNYFRKSPTFFRNVMAYLTEQGIVEKVGTADNATRRYTRYGLAIAKKISELPY